VARDRELAKLVMRVMSMQEMLQQSRQVPVPRYTSHTNSSTYMFSLA